MTLAAEGTDAAFDFHHAADVEACEVNGYAAKGATIEAGRLRRSLWCCCAVCSVRRGACCSAVPWARHLHYLPAAVVEAEREAVVRGVESDDYADEADPLDRVVEVEVDLLGCEPLAFVEYSR